MEKKDLKFYEAPAVELEEMELEGFLCASFTMDDDDWKARQTLDFEEEEK